MSNDVRNRGFTMIEVLISMAVVAAVLLTALFSNTRIQRASQAAFERSIALQDANQILEQMRVVADTNGLTGVVNEYQDGKEVASSNFSGELPNQKVVVNYKNTTSDPLDVTVTVQWDANSVRGVEATLRTLITQRTT